ncbi:hypothetical protein CEXT_328231 [Caerostris extrusa]|uniref:Uncharacterized protein n=1 Tax=Caerostris extrusa TaxID=172846 RepID=A0AAV4TLL8_CAEEX|nr:hypothetical protein CEXT_328231 [Caerostris extrusa]
MKKNLSMTGGYNNEKESEKKSLFVWAFAREMKARKSRLNPRTQLFLLKILPPGPLITRLRQQINRFHRIFLRDEPTSGPRGFPSSSSLKKDRKLNFCVSINLKFLKSSADWVRKLQLSFGTK